MNIDRNNYESILVDYLDGKLDANELSEVLLFLEQNPDIKAELEGVSEIRVSTLSAEFVSFDYLKQKEFTDVKQNYESLLIASVERELTAQESAVLERGFQLYPELTYEQKLFSLTVLQPDYAIKYLDKQSLKKGSVWAIHRNSIIRVAAIFLIIGTAGWFFLRNQYSLVTSAQQTASLHERISSQAQSTLGAPSIQSTPLSSKNKSSYTKQESKTLPEATSTLNTTRIQSAKNKWASTKQVKIISPVAIEKNHFQLALIQEMEPKAIVYSEPKINNKLNDVSTWLTYKQPTYPIKNEDNFPDLKTLANASLNRGAQQLEEKTLSVFEAMNKAAGVSVDKDLATGKIKRFEIARLGFEWSQSK